ncbi:MAG: glucosamine-6-phosphate deaminase [Acidobacteria bacterium 13_1_20CM_4_56_7]|nr:MAG: glucosamine-6-phosphate deaminase [Acidobacteria bacterium 13_1_20CM_4_56_7]
MLLALKSSPEEVGREAARIVANAVRRNPELRLGLATGNTTVGMYKELIRLHEHEGLDFSRVITFNLDEYLGLSADHPRSFRHFMQQNFFSQVNIPPRSIHIPNGSIKGDYQQYCASYEQKIRDAGGIDLQVLGIGRNGHIGFNEPTSSIGSRTRLKVLSKDTTEDNRKFFASGEEIPQCAITMGIGTILDAKRILLLATGSSKAAAIAAAIEGPLTASVTASALQLHADVTFIVDQQAGALLKRLFVCCAYRARKAGTTSRN